MVEMLSASKKKVPINLIFISLIVGLSSVIGLRYNLKASFLNVNNGKFIPNISNLLSVG